VNDGIEVTSTLDNAIDIQRDIQAGGVLNVYDATLDGTKAAIEMPNILGTVNVGTVGTTTTLTSDQDGISMNDILSGGELNVVNATIDTDINGVDLNNVDGGALYIADSAIDADVNGIDINLITNAADVDIEDTVITGTNNASRGIRIESVINGSTADLTNNTVGTSTDVIFRGIDVSDVQNATLNISGGSVTSKNDAISINDILSGGTVNVNDGIEVTSTRDDTIDIQRAIQEGGVLNVSDVTFDAGKNGIELDLVAGEVNVGSKETTTTITADGDGIHSGNLWLGPYEEGQVNVINTDITAGDDGVDLNNVYESVIMDNTITAGDDGVYVNEFDNTLVTWNTITNVGDDGVEVEFGNSATIDMNTITNAGTAAGTDSEYFDGRGSDGITVYQVDNGLRGTIGSSDPEAENVYNDSVVITNNVITNTADDGIQVVDSGDTLIQFNEVTDAGAIEGDSFADGLGADGISVIHTGDNNYATARILTDMYLEEGDETEYVGPFDYTNLRILDNTVANSADDGIEVINIYGLFVQEISTVSLAESMSELQLKPLLKNPYAPTSSSELWVQRNEVTNSGDNGIALVTGNTSLPVYDLETETMSSVQLISMNSDLVDNTVTNAGNNGIVAEGAGHGDVILAGNTVTDAPTGARFESGAVDFTGATNTFEITEEFEAPEGFDFVTGVQFDLANPEAPTSLTIVEETLGTTVFSGYNGLPVGESFYSRFEDGAILDENGNVIEIDGVSATFDGVTPSTVPNFFRNSDELLAIEARLRDADDEEEDGRGQIFVNEGPLLDPADFLQERGFGQFGTSGIDVTVTGLPAISSAGLNNIQPAAGDEETGTSDQDLASIEPAAGGEQASCWNDAIDSASAGSPVRYSYGSGFGEGNENTLSTLTGSNFGNSSISFNRNGLEFDQSLNDATSCSSTFQ